MFFPNFVAFNFTSQNFCRTQLIHNTEIIFIILSYTDHHRVKGRTEQKKEYQLNSIPYHTSISFRGSQQLTPFLLKKLLGLPNKAPSLSLTRKRI